MTVVEYAVSLSANDGVWQTAKSYFNASSVTAYFGRSSVDLNNFFRFAGVMVPQGATIVESYITFVYKNKSGTIPECDLYFEDADNPTKITGYLDGDSRVKTTATIKVAPPAGLTAGNTWNTSSLNTIIQEVVDRAGWESGNAMLCLVFPPSGLSDNNYSGHATWNDSIYDPPLLHIEYTEAAAGGKVNLIGPGLIGQSPLINRSPLLSW